MNWTDVQVLSKTGVNWDDIESLSKTNVNWTDIQVMSEQGVNWNDIQVMSDQGVNWNDLEVLSNTGVNWSDIDVLGDSGINWNDISIIVLNKGSPWVNNACIADIEVHHQRFGDEGEWECSIHYSRPIQVQRVQPGLAWPPSRDKRNDVGGTYRFARTEINSQNWIKTSVTVLFQHERLRSTS